MRRIVKSSNIKMGLPPGTVIHVGEPVTFPVAVKVMQYNAESCSEQDMSDIDSIRPPSDLHSVTWIDVEGIHQAAMIEKIGASFQIHPLVLEDIVNSEHRPKLEEWDQYVVIILKIPEYDEAANEVTVDQFSVVLHAQYVLSFQERELKEMEVVRNRIRDAKGYVRHRGTDFLAYVLFDVIVDHYFVTLEKLADKIENLEDALIMNVQNITPHMMYTAKRNLMQLQRTMIPVQEVIIKLIRLETKLIDKGTNIFLRDVSDHLTQITDNLKHLQDDVDNMLAIYLSLVSNKTNEIMKLLTIIATMFIPLTFLTGVYGMNFEHLPELSWKWGYAAFWMLTVGLSGGMLLYFKKRQWI